MATPRLGWIGAHVEGMPALQALLEQGAPIVAVITLAPEQASRLSGAVDYRPLCEAFGVPLYQVRNINDDDSLALLRRLALDLAFVIGWTQIVGPRALALIRRGAIGAHASLLPAFRGRAPINWAILRGLSQTGNSLIWLSDEVDAGDVIDQTPFPITFYDTCATLYEQVARSNREMLLRVVPHLLAGKRPGTRQTHAGDPALPGRRPADGRIDWGRSALAVYDAVRAQTRPYPGAFSWLGDRRYRVWRAAWLSDATIGGGDAGTVTGVVRSPVPEACGVIVACGAGRILILEVEDDEGDVLSGPSLSEQPWVGQRWGDPT